MAGVTGGNLDFVDQAEDDNVSEMQLNWDESATVDDSDEQQAQADSPADNRTEHVRTCRSWIR
jgi:hypothetical protein